jgi:hypothetical protein
MIRNFNKLTKSHTPLRVAFGILLLIFCSTCLFQEAIAAQETAGHKNTKAHWGYEPDNRPTQPLNDRTLQYDVVGEIIN